MFKHVHSILFRIFVSAIIITGTSVTLSAMEQSGDTSSAGGSAAPSAPARGTTDIVRIVRNMNSQLASIDPQFQGVVSSMQEELEQLPTLPAPMQRQTRILLGSQMIQTMIQTGKLDTLGQALMTNIDDLKEKAERLNARLAELNAQSAAQQNHIAELERSQTALQEQKAALQVDLQKTQDEILRVRNELHHNHITALSEQIHFLETLNITIGHCLLEHQKNPKLLTKRTAAEGITILLSSFFHSLTPVSFGIIAIHLLENVLTFESVSKVWKQLAAFVPGRKYQEASAKGTLIKLRNTISEGLAALRERKAALEREVGPAH